MKKIISTAAMVMMAMTTMIFSSCEDVFIADNLSGTICKIWEGRISTYYEDRWGLTGDDYHTVMQFNSNPYSLTRGTGSEVDYDIHNPYGNYWYSDFEWRVKDGVIELRYADTDFMPVYIYEYTLTDNFFSGYMDDGTNKEIVFRLSLRESFDWSPYYGEYLPSQKRMAPEIKDSVSTIKGRFGSKGSFAKKRNDIQPFILQKGK